LVAAACRLSASLSRTSLLGRTSLRPFIRLFANADFIASRSLLVSLQLGAALSRRTSKQFRNVLIAAAPLFLPSKLTPFRVELISIVFFFFFFATLSALCCGCAWNST
jgi:hypothetical protein